MTRQSRCSRFSGEFPGIIPAAWFKQHPIPSNMLNTCTVLVPDNENYYIRNIHRALEWIRDPALSGQVQEFIRQGGQQSDSNSCTTVVQTGFDTGQGSNYFYAQEFLNSAAFQAASAEYSANGRLKKTD